MYRECCYEKFSTEEEARSAYRRWNEDFPKKTEKKIETEQSSTRTRAGRRSNIAEEAPKESVLVGKKPVGEAASSGKKLYYIVLESKKNGVFDNIEEATERVATKPGAFYEVYETEAEARKAYALHPTRWRSPDAPQDMAMEVETRPRKQSVKPYTYKASSSEDRDPMSF